MAAQVHLRGAIAIALLALAAPRTAPPIDLDVGVPPGSPTGWARSIPVVTPRLHPWRAVTQRLPKGGTVAGVPRRPVDRGLSGAGVLRIATPDVTGHLEWVNGLRPDGKVVTGGALASLPPVSAGLRWVGIAAFLRLLLHRQQVAGPEVVAHLVEIGEPAAWCAEAAAAEDALAEPAKDVLRRIDKGPRGSRPPVGACLREAMWLRFVGEELAAAHPFDPEGGFGSRLFLFAEEVEPLLVRWLQADADRFVVRNAAAALGRYHTTTAQAALAAAVATTRDEVVLMRALAALEPGCDADPLLKRLAGNNDDVEVAALVAALGRILATGAVPTLLDRMRNHPDPDLLLTTLVALNRIAQPGDRSGAADWAAAICSAARADPGRFRVRARASAADVPDQASLRGETVEQLATCLRVRLGAAGADRALGALLSERMAGHPGASFANEPIRAFWPAAQIPVLETLPHLKDEGQRVLTALVADAGTDPVLRVAALCELPAEVRDPLAETQAVDDSAPLELRLASLLLLERDGSAQLGELCRRLCRRVRAQAPAIVAAQPRQLAVAALQAQPQVDAADVGDLCAWLGTMKTGPRAADADAIARIRDLAASLVDDVADGLKPAQVEARIAALVDEAVAARVDARFSPATRGDTIAYVRGLLANVHRNRNDRAYRAMVRRELADYFAPAARAMPREIEVAVVAPLEEEILFAIGRSRTPAAVTAIARLLATGDARLRAHACLAAASSGGRALLQPLVHALLDDDGFVRLCAGEALRHMTGKDVAGDWLYGALAERGAAAEQWFRIVAGESR